MDSPLKFSYYAMHSLFFVGLFGLISIHYNSPGIILPDIFPLVMAIILHPVIKLLVRLKNSRFGNPWPIINLFSGV